ncbi:MAG: response regulator [Oligoflexia bacterium]|nr:response regulator [Oligoflexia bacterium]
MIDQRKQNNQTLPSSSLSLSLSPSPFKKFLLLFSILLIMSLIIINRFHYYHKTKIDNTLITILEHKVEIIEHLFQDIKNQANNLATRSHLNKTINSYINNVNIKKLKDLKEKNKREQVIVEQLHIWLQNTNFSNILLYSIDGNYLAGVEARAGAGQNSDIDNSKHPIIFKSEFQKTINENKIVFADLKQMDLNHKIHICMGLFIPVRDVLDFKAIKKNTSYSSKVTAVLFAAIDPFSYFFPAIQSWPLPSNTAESLIFRQEGDSVRFLNGLKHISTGPLSLLLPIEKNKDVPAIKAVLGETKTIINGFDYRGVKVLAFAKKIPGTPWFILSKDDYWELYTSLYIEIALIIMILIISIIAIIYLLNFYSRKREHTLLIERLQSEKSHQNLFNNMSEGISTNQLILDDTGKAVDYKIINCNSSFLQLIQKSELPSNLSASQVYNISPPPFLEQFTNLIQKKNISLSKFEKYSPILKKYLRVSTYLEEVDNKFTTIYEDITYRKQSEDLLFSEKERLLVTLRSIGDGVIVTDDNGNITLMNKVSEELTGWSLEDAYGKALPQVFQIINERTGVKCENPVDKVLQTGRIIGLANHTALIAKDKTLRVIADSGAPIRASDGKIVGVVLVFRDITNEQKIEERLRKSERLDSLGILAGGIAHDFNNLLSGLFGYIDVAKTFCQQKQCDEAVKYLNNSLRVFSRAKDLTGQLLTFAKGGSPIKRVQSLIPLIQHASSFMLSGSSIGTTLKIAEDLWPAEIDGNQIGQVLDNIVLNARQAMPLGGHLQISALNTKYTTASNTLPHLPHDLEIGNYVEIIISDNGTGISEEHLAKIFDPFFTTKQQGSGLGLATAHSIITKHNGIIDVKSTLGKGTTFTIYLPAIPEAIPTVFSPTSAFPSLDLKSVCKVLVMDDEEDICNICKTILTKAGCEVEISLKGEDALLKIKAAINSNNIFNVIILDLTIENGLGGLEIIKDIRALDSNVVVIASSGYSDAPVISTPKNFGFNDAITKPFTKIELINLIKKNL